MLVTVLFTYESSTEPIIFATVLTDASQETILKTAHELLQCIPESYELVSREVPVWPEVYTTPTDEVYVWRWQIRIWTKKDE